MGAAFFLAVEGKPDFKTGLAGKALAKESARINALTRANGMRSLEDFFSLGPDDAIASMADILGVDVDELSEDQISAARSGAADNWFLPIDGEEFCTSLISLVRNNASNFGDPDAILADLNVMANDMQLLSEQRLRWRFNIDY